MMASQSIQVSSWCKNVMTLYRTTYSGKKTQTVCSVPQSIVLLSIEFATHIPEHVGMASVNISQTLLALPTELWYHNNITGVLSCFLCNRKFI